jgi:hypothetical protein
MQVYFLMLALVSTSAWGQLLVPTQKADPWAEQFQFSPNMVPQPAMLITPPNLPKKPTPRRAKKVLRKRSPPKKEGQGILSTIPIIKEIPKLLDGTQESVTSRLTGLADNVDSFFAEKRADDELNRSRIRLNYSYTLYAEKKPIDDYAIRMNIRFPKLEQRVKDFFLGPEEEKDKKDLAAQARRKKREKNPWIFRTDAGMNLAYPPIFFTRARLRKNWDLPIFIQRFTEELAWVSDQGVIQTTTLHHDYDVSDNLLFRIVNEQEWYIEPKEFTTAHGPSFIHKLSEDDGISYSFRVKSEIDGPWYMTGYGLGVRYRRNLRNQWLYGEIGPALDFPKTEGFRRTPSVLLRIESLFGQR